MLVLYTETAKATMVEKQVMEEIMIPPDSMFVWHRYSHHAGAELYWKLYML